MANEDRYKRALEKILRTTKGAEMGFMNVSPVRSIAHVALHPNDKVQKPGNRR